MIKNIKVFFKNLKIKYEIINSLNYFTNSMYNEMIKNIPEKGNSYKICDNEYLKEKLFENFDIGNWVNVVNFAFMLSMNEKEKIELNNIDIKIGKRF